MVDVSNTQVASVDVVEEATSEDKVAEIYKDIKTTLGIDFIPNMYSETRLTGDDLEENPVGYGQRGPLGSTHTGHRRVDGVDHKRL